MWGKIVNTIFSSLIIGLLISCGQPKNELSDKTVLLDEDLLFQAIPMQMSDVWYPADSIYATRYYVYADSILIVENQKQAGRFLDFYDMRSHKLVTSRLPYGEGPNEWLFIQLFYEENAMRVVDYLNRRFCNLDIHNVLTDANYQPRLIPYARHIITSPVVQFGDSVIYVNPFHYVNHRMNIDQRPPRFYTLSESELNSSQNMDYEYLTPNVGQGFTGANSRVGKIFFAQRNASEIEFYNSQLELTKIISGPIQIPEAELYIDAPKSGMRNVTFTGKGRPKAYEAYTALGEKLYFLYTGEYVEWDKETHYPSYILCFDWDGNLLQSYRAPMRLENLSVSSSEPNVFYATIKDEEDNPRLVKLIPAGE